MIISKCPICGRYPRYHNVLYDSYIDADIVKIQCKPLFGKIHLLVVGKDFLEAAKEWNENCELLRESIREHDV